MIFFFYFSTQFNRFLYVKYINLNIIITMKVFLLFAVAFTVANGVAIYEASKNFAQIKVERMFKRSLSEAPTYQVHITGLGETHKLNLRSPSQSIFGEDFQYLEATTDSETGELQLNEATPNTEELRSIESNFYTDPESQATVSMKRNVGSDTYHFSGRINDVAIRTQEDNVHEIIKKSTRVSRIEDFVDLNRTIVPGKTSRATSRAQPEVLVIWDYAASQQFDFNRNKILDYVGVFFHGVNNRYATAQDPVVVFKLSGVIVVNSKSAQPYMENNQVPGGYDISKTLDDLSFWLYSNSRNTVKYDVAALISNTDMQMEDSSGSYTSAVAGLAYLKAACWNYTQARRYLGASVSEDLGGYYDGIFTVAHELAHNLGSPHDGDKTPDATDCPWSQGYLMSYEGWGTKNKFYLSPCSLRLMKELIDSQQGNCVKSDQASTIVPISDDQPGDRFDMKQMCIKLTKQSNAVPDPKSDPNDLCKSLKCRFTKDGWIYTQSFGQPPRDNAPCGNGGRCKDGDCVGQS